MSHVKFNESRFQELQTHIDNAKRLSEEALENDWAQNFGNLYNNFITNGFLEKIYKDAESNYNLIFGGGTALLCGAGATIAGTAAATGATAVTVASVSFCIPVVGWIIGAIILGILAIVGIWYVVKAAADIQFKHDARDIFEKLLTECAECTQANYLMLEDFDTRLETAKLNLQKIIFRIDEFNTEYQNMSKAADDVGVKIKTADDGVTVLEVETTVTVNGEQLTVSTSEAMNAWYTYNETAMNARIAADYLQSQGYDVDLLAIMKNVNAFSASTLKSGLYSNDFVLGLFPEYAKNLPSVDAAKKTAADQAGLSSSITDEILKKMFGGDLASLAAGGAALLGISALGGAFKKPNSANNNTGTTPGGNTGTKPGTNPSGPGNNNPGSNPSGPGNNNNNGGTKPGDNPNGEDDKPVEKPEDKPTEKPTNDIKIPEISTVKLPEKVELSYEIDYDKLAREQFEFEGDFDKIIEDRINLVNQVETLFDNGDTAKIAEKLTEFGYNSAEINVILEDKLLTTKAVLEGTQNALLAQKAVELAKADGVENFVSKYSERPNFADLSTTEASENLTLASGDKKVVKAYDDMKEKREEYHGKVKDANEALVDVNENKKTVEELKAKYEKEYGEDTKEWPEEAAKEYSESIDKYNESVENANNKVKEAEEAQKVYEDKNKEFEDARAEALEKLNGNIETVNGAHSTDSGMTIDGVEVGNTGNVEGSYNPDMNGVTIDGVDQSGSVPNVNNTNNMGTVNNINPVGVDPNMANNAILMSQTEQILNSIKTEGENLIIEG